MDLLRALRQSTAPSQADESFVAKEIVPRPITDIVPNDELAVAEIGLVKGRPGPVQLYTAGFLARRPTALSTRRGIVPHLRMLLAGRIKRSARLPSLRGFAAMFAVIVAAAVLSRAPGGTEIGTVYPAGAAGALLTATDLGETWAEGGLTFDLGAVPTAAYDPNGFARGSCGRTAADPTSGAVAARSANFNNGNRFISDQVGVFASATVAHERYAAYRSALAACRSWTATTSDGGQLALRLDPLKTQHKLGDESAIYRMEGVVTPAKAGLPQSTAVQAAVVVMRRLNALSVVAEMSIGYLGQAADARTSDATLAASVADSKLARLATVSGPLRGGGDTVDEPKNYTSSTDQKQETGLAVGTPHVLATNDGGKVAVTVLRMIDSATGEDGYLPKAGSRFVAVQVRLGNVGERTYDDSPENGAILIDARGEQHYADLAEISAGDGFGGHVRLGAEDTRTGYIVFQVPQGVAPRTFQFALDSGFAPSMGQWSVDQASNL